MKILYLKIIGLAALIFSFLLTLYVAWVVTTIPIDNNLFENSESVLKSAGTVEAGSYLKKETLKSYFNFLTGQSYEKWFEQAKEQGVIEIEKNKIFFLKTIDLPPPLKNNCKAIYCLQNRLKFEEIPSVFWKGLIGVEDNRFVSHVGVDPKSILRALVTDIKKMKLEQGGSTLTQQLIKNLYLSNDKKFIRKIKEMILSVYFENKFSKEEILEIYFNEIEWGSLQGVKIKGIHTAVLMYFNKKMDEVEPFEAAIIISMLKGPYYYSPLRHLKRLRTRAEVVYKKLQELDLFSKNDSPWSDSDWEKWINRLDQIKLGTSYMAFWRAGKEDFKQSNFEKYSMIYSSQKLLQQIKEKVGKKDIAIKFILGNLKKDEIGGYYSKFERSKVAALSEEIHQIGSTIKPILYNIYRKQGVRNDDLVETGPITFKLKSGVWQPREPAKELPAEVTVEEALIKSMNRPNLRLAQSIGFDKVEVEFESYVPTLKKPLSEYPAQLLGAVEITLEDLFKVYKKFFLENCLSQSEHNWVIEKLSDPNSTTIRNVVSKELGRMKFFGKTGTTNNGYDNWFIGFDGTELIILWVGFEGVKNTKDLKLYGSSSAFKLYQDFVTDRGKRFGDMMCQFKEKSF